MEYCTLLMKSYSSGEGVQNITAIMLWNSSPIGNENQRGGFKYAQYPYIITCSKWKTH